MTPDQVLVELNRQVEWLWSTAVGMPAPRPKDFTEPGEYEVTLHEWQQKCFRYEAMRVARDAVILVWQRGGWQLVVPEVSDGEINDLLSGFG